MYLVMGYESVSCGLILHPPSKKSGKKLFVNLAESKMDWRSMRSINDVFRYLRATSILIGGIALLISGCSKTVTVQLPPRVDLAEWPVIGIVEFTADQHRDLAPSATQKFLMYVQNAQRGVRLLELGGQEEILKSIQHKHLDIDAIKAIGEKYGVQAVLTGRVLVTEAKPDVSFSRDLSTASAGASINGELNAKLQETSTGSTVWSNGAHGKWSIGGVTLGSGGLSNIGYADPKEKYDQIIRELAEVATEDFRFRYEKRKAN